MSSILICLLGLCAVSASLRNARMLGTSVILLANWTINTSVVQWTGDPYPWPWFLATDYLSGFIVLIVGGRPKPWQVLITVSYAFECVAHGAYGLSVRGVWQNYYYWHSLHYVAWLQLWIIVGWASADVARRFGVSFRRTPSRDTRMAGDRRGPVEP